MPRGEIEAGNILVFTDVDTNLKYLKLAQYTRYNVYKDVHMSNIKDSVGRPELS